MCKLSPFRTFFSLISIVCVFLSAGCGSQTPHLNQLSGFDGASYDSLLLAHGALTSLRAQVAVAYPKYAPIFNQAVISYAATYNAYALYRSNPKDQTQVAVAVANLTISIVALENTFQNDLRPSSAMVMEVHRRARTLKARAVREQLTVSDILTELEIAAAVARAIPATAPYAGLASLVIDATSEALTAEALEVGQPIDLTKILPIAAI